MIVTIIWLTMEVNTKLKEKQHVIEVKGTEISNISADKKQPIFFSIKFFTSPGPIQRAKQPKQNYQKLPAVAWPDENTDRKYKARKKLENR